MRAKIQGSIGFLLIAVFLLSVPASAQEKQVSVPFTVQHGEIVIPAMIDGKPANLILDTGAVDTSLDKEVANLTGEQRSGRTADGKQITVQVGESIIEIAGSKFRSQVLVMPKLFSEAEGVLGQNILSRFSEIKIDYKHKLVMFAL